MGENVADRVEESGAGALAEQIAAFPVRQDLRGQERDHVEEDFGRRLRPVFVARSQPHHQGGSEPRRKVSGLGRR